MATNLQDLIAEVKNLVPLAPVLNAISRPEISDAIVLIKTDRIYYFGFFSSASLFPMLELSCE